MTLRAQPITEEWQAGIREGNPAQYVVVSQMAGSYMNITIIISLCMTCMI
jgi:hypothetical protein